MSKAVMSGSLVVLTGASGSGKTTIAHAFRAAYPDAYDVVCLDADGVPSPEVIQSYGDGHQPGGAWQRAMTFQFLAGIAEKLNAGRSVLFEGQMRVAFIHEGLRLAGIQQARVLLVDCDDTTRTARLTHDRAQPELANAQMMNWAAYLRDEAAQRGCEVLDTGTLSVEEAVAYLERCLRSRPD